MYPTFSTFNVSISLKTDISSTSHFNNVIASMFGNSARKEMSKSAADGLEHCAFAFPGSVVYIVEISSVSIREFRHF